MRLIKVITTKRGNTIQLKVNDSDEFIVTELKDAGYPSEQILSVVKSTVSHDHALERLSRLRKLMRKGWSQLPSWVLVAPYYEGI